MRKNPPVFPVVALVCALALNGCCFLGLFCNKQEYCCMQYHTGSLQQQFCSQYNAVAFDYIRGGNAPGEDVRTDLFEDFLEIVDTCESLDCITVNVNDHDAAMPGLKDEYDDRSAIAADIGVDASLQVDLALCGLHDGFDKRVYHQEHPEG